MRYRVNLFRYYYLCLMSMNWLSTNWLFTNWLCEHVRARARARAPATVPPPAPTRSIPGILFKCGWLATS